MGIVKQERNCMLEATKNETLRALNELVEDWRNIFDIPPPKPISFSIKNQDTLYVNDIALCPVCDVNVQDLSCEPDALFIGSNDRGHYRIAIIWNYHNQIFIGEVSLVLFSC